MHTSTNDWIRRDAIHFSGASDESFNAAVDRVVAALGDSVELLGFGEAMHGGEEILVMRNRLFKRLVAAHGYRAIAIESSFPGGFVVDDYIAGRGGDSYEDVNNRGFSSGFAGIEANRELVEWIRAYNAGASDAVKLRFYGFDIPAALTGIAAPSQVLRFVLDYVCAMDEAIGETHRTQIEEALGADSDWENPAAYADPSLWVGRSPAATTLRVATEDLITDLLTHRPEWSAKSGKDRFGIALQHSVVARQILNFHAALADNVGYARLLGIRDASMADNLGYIADRERSDERHGKIFVFAHNSHLQRGKITFPVLGEWWSAGSHLNETLGRRYAVIGSGLVASEANGIAPAEPETLEAMIAEAAKNAPGSTTFIPTYAGQHLSPEQTASIPTRSSSTKNPSYKPLSRQSLSDFDSLAVLESATYTRGARPLPK